MSLAFLAFRLLVLQSENRPGAVCNLRVAPNACPFTLAGYLKGRSAVSKPLELSTTLSRPPGRCTGTARSGNLCAYSDLTESRPRHPAGAFFCLHHAASPSVISRAERSACLVNHSRLKNTSGVPRVQIRGPRCSSANTSAPNSPVGSFTSCRKNK